MAQPGNLYDSYDAKGLREDLSDLIYNISPTDTPVLTAAGTTNATARFHEWQTDKLDTPNGDNAAIEGDDAALVEPTPSVRVGNYTVIQDKVFGVSGTLEVVDKAGRQSEMAYQAAIKARSLKTDCDSAISAVNQGTVAGDNATARRTASLEAWLTTNTSFGATGADGGWTGTAVNARTDGNLRNNQQSFLDDMCQSAYDNGGMPSMLVCGTVQKKNVSGFDGVGTIAGAGGANDNRRTDAGDRTIYATADVYVSNFMTLNIVASRHIRKTANIDRTMFGIDPEYIKVAYLRPWQQFDLAKTGDSIKRQMLVEWALQVSNEAAHFGIFDLQ